MALNEPFFVDLGLWLGFGLSLFLLSFLIRDNFLARLAQHLLAGVAMGYLALVAWHDVLQPRLIAPLLNGQLETLWLPAFLSVILLAAGLHRILTQPWHGEGELPRPARPGIPARLLFGLGRLPVAILLGTAMGVGIVGALEGTLWPQYVRAAQIALDPGAPVGRILIGLLTLVLTTGVMVHLYVDPARFAAPQPAFVRRTLLAWIWIGRHAIWFAAGILFARLLAARMSLLIVLIQTLVHPLTENPVMDWLQMWLAR